MALLKHNGDSGGGGGGHGGESLRWLVTYADMITLLMAFFIMLYSMSVMNISKFRQLALSVRSGFGGDWEGRGINMVSTGADINLRPGIGPSVPPPPLYRLERDVTRYVVKKGLSQKVTVHQEPRGLVLSFRSDHLLFDRGKAELRPQAEAILNDVAAKIRPLSHSVRVEGHTCNLPIRTAQFPSNWELSTARATSVVRYLITQGKCPPARLSAAGYADTHPIASNASEDQRVFNRRVDIVVLSEAASQEEPGSSLGEDIRSQLSSSWDFVSQLFSSLQDENHTQTRGLAGRH